MTTAIDAKLDDWTRGKIVAEAERSDGAKIRVTVDEGRYTVLRAFAIGQPGRAELSVDKQDADAEGVIEFLLERWCR
jgi:hypothetical protein